MMVVSPKKGLPLVLAARTRPMLLKYRLPVREGKWRKLEHTHNPFDCELWTTQTSGDGCRTSLVVRRFMYRKEVGRMRPVPLLEVLANGRSRYAARASGIRIPQVQLAHRLAHGYWKQTKRCAVCGARSLIQLVLHDDFSSNI
jgi:hypothetical protein